MLPLIRQAPDTAVCAERLNSLRRPKLATRDFFVASLPRRERLADWRASKTATPAAGSCLPFAEIGVSGIPSRDPCEAVPNQPCISGASMACRPTRNGPDYSSTSMVSPSMTRVPLPGNTGSS